MLRFGIQIEHGERVPFCSSQKRIVKLRNELVCMLNMERTPRLGGKGQTNDTRLERIKGFCYRGRTYMHSLQNETKSKTKEKKGRQMKARKK